MLLARDYAVPWLPDYPAIWYRALWPGSISAQEARLLISGYAATTNAVVALPMEKTQEPFKDLAGISLCCSAVLLQGITPGSRLVDLRLPEPVNNLVAACWADRCSQDELKLAHLVCAEPMVERQGWEDCRESVVAAIVNANGAGYFGPIRNEDSLDDSELPRESAGILMGLMDTAKPGGTTGEGTHAALALTVGRNLGRATCKLTLGCHKQLVSHCAPAASPVFDPATSISRYVAVMRYVADSRSGKRDSRNSQQQQPGPRCLFLGADATGKTTALYLLKLGEDVTTIPTIGFNTETIDVRNTSCQLNVWDIGGQSKLRPLWRHYYQGTDALVYFVRVDVLYSEEIQRLTLPAARADLGSVLSEMYGDMSGAPNPNMSVTVLLTGNHSPEEAARAEKELELDALILESCGADGPRPGAVRVLDVGAVDSGYRSRLEAAMKIVAGAVQIPEVEEFQEVELETLSATEIWRVLGVSLECQSPHEGAAP
eukprot:TRINITY_DN55103_c0_g1_i4.p1 TRINITY_DN55103_c0_g1~~TRINITY_DN55103_c0_g1_i4.p1  ORF type:complete len:487 (+),score=79.64 TRINITY_DN55103_c0_g1_i4:236-1696(+)